MINTMSRRLTKEQFILKARQTHGWKYDYSKVDYVNNLTKITIICPIHGEFQQTPGNHLQGAGCPKCNTDITTQINKKLFVKKAEKIHGDKYDYSKVEYVNSKTKVCIICPEHSEFYQTPNAHLQGQGCPECGGTKKLTTNTFIAKACEIHGNKYDYSNVVYKNNRTKIDINCHLHGIFKQTPHDHLQGNGCPECMKILNAKSRTLTTSEFIEKARNIHDTKYDYTKTLYVRNDKKVCIICPIHGEFYQTPNVHLDGCGCPKCADELKSFKKRLTTEQFIERAKKIHGDKYDYSKVNYVNSLTKVCIVCPEHGEFWQFPFDHVNEHGCPKCATLKQTGVRRVNFSNPNKLTLEQFIERAHKVHGNKYDYSKVEYNGIDTKVCLICHEKDENGIEHGEFWQTPLHHLQGHGCRKCVKRYQYTTNDFINKLKMLYGTKFDYSKVEYVNTSTPVCLICHEKDENGIEHGEFYPLPVNLLKGNMNGCPKCAKNIKYTTEEWVEKMKNKFKEKNYDYSKVEYVNATTKVCIICPKHGEFWQTPHCHDTGKGCPKCRTSTLEIAMETALKEHGVKYIRQYKEIFKKNRSSKQSLDFYLPDYNIGIECQELQHFIKKWYSDKGEKELTEIEERDIRKRKVCKEHGIKLVYLYRKKDEKFVPTNDGYKYFDSPLELINYIRK